MFAAASLTEAFQAAGRVFEARHPGVKVTFNFAGSQQLRAQLAQGAQADVFASANLQEMDAARQQGLVGDDSAVFATNRLVVIVPRDNPGNIQTLQDLARPGLKVVVAEASVPAGQYTLQMLGNMSADRQGPFGPDFEAKVLKNVVSKENNVRQVVAKVQLGEADAGVVYLTDVTPAAAPALKSIAIPDAYNQVAHYAIAVLQATPRRALARQFVDFVLAADGGQQILQQSGFRPAR